MNYVVLTYSASLKESLLKYDTPFAVDETEGTPSNITVFLQNDSRICSKVLGRIEDKFIIAINSILNRQICIEDHFNESVYSNSVFEFPIVYITCYSKYHINNGYKNIDPGKYSTFYYNGKSCANTTDGQNDFYELELPVYCLPIKDDNGQIIGHMSYRRIDFHFDIFHSKLKVLHYQLIKDCVENYLKIEDDLKKLLEEYLEIKGRLDLIKFIQTMADKQKKKTKEDIHTVELTIKDYNSQLKNLYSKLRELILMLKGFESETINVEKEIEKLVEAYNIKFDPSGLFWFETEDIYYKKEILLGRYRISIDTNNGVVKVTNLTRKIENYDHPHIKDGTVCLGELSNQIAKLMSEYKYFDVAKLCSELLYFYNSSSAYISIERWI